jgi:prepilin-type N-terminal cleavage/methylation domain-containing protein
MANKTSPNSFTLAWLLRARLTLRSGFTLIELLIAVVVGGIIVSTMLYLVVELLQINRREEVLTQTQQDMRRALDYIARDAGEAVYIYPTPFAGIDTDLETDTNGDDDKTNDEDIELIDQIDNFPADAVPVLAFWRLDPLDPTNKKTQELFDKDCNKDFTGTKISECNTLKARQGYYTLVIYAQQKNDDDTLWGGQARIIRYELPKYSSANLPNLVDNPGYAEPTGENNSFANWVKGPGTANGRSTVLTDYLDNPVPDQSPECPANYLATPAESDNFYACVRLNTSEEDGDGLTIGSNQTLVVFLRGNAATEKAGFVTFSDVGRLPTLKSEVLIRGVLDKRPEDL